MKKSAYLSDILFTFFLTGLFTLCVFRHLKTPLILAFVLATVCGLLAACSCAAFLKSKRKTFLLKRSDEALREKLFLHLPLISDEEKTKLFETALAKPQNTEVKRQGKLRLQTEEANYFLLFRFAPVTADEIARLSRWKTSKPKIVLCQRIEETAKALCTKLHMEVKTGDWVFDFLKSQDALPNRFLGDELPENKRKRIFRLCFAKRNARRFFVSAALILLTSLITPFPYYYLVFGGILLLVALFIRIFGYSS